MGVEALPGPTEAYVVGTSRDPTEAVLLLPDIWGWDSGRMRAVADSIAAVDYKVVVPKILAPLDGGTDGDGLPTPFDMANERERMTEHFKANWGWPKVGGKITAVTDALKDCGVERIVIVGTCYGAWAGCHVSKHDASIVGIFGPHPSIGAEGGRFGGDNVELCKAVQCEVFVAPAGNDSQDYDEAGAMFKAFKPGSRTVRFPEMKHGWFVRGDVADAAVKRDIELTFSHCIEWINAKFSPKTKLY